MGRLSILPVLDRLRRKASSLESLLDRPDDVVGADPLPSDPSQGGFELGFYGGLLSRSADEIRVAMDIATELVRSRRVHTIRLTVQPGDILQGKLELIPRELPLSIELDVPSLVPAVFLQQAEVHHPDAVLQAYNLIRNRAIRWGIQLTPGLPGSTPLRELETLSALLELAPHAVRITPALVLKGTGLEQLFLRGLYCPWGLDETVQWCLTMLQRLEAQQIPVIRVGLQPKRDLHLDSAQVVAGPYHPSLRSLVQALGMRQRLEVLLSHQLVAGHQITFRVHPASQTAARGPENENFRWLCRRFHCTSVHLRLDPSMREDAIMLEGIVPATFDMLPACRSNDLKKGT